MRILEKNNLREIAAEGGRFLHRVGSDAYFTRGVMLPGETEADFEETDEVPEAGRPEDYGERVNDLIRRCYSLSEELAILRQKDTKPDEFAEYDAYAEECKVLAKNNHSVDANEMV